MGGRRLHADLFLPGRIDLPHAGGVGLPGARPAPLRPGPTAKRDRRTPESLAANAGGLLTVRGLQPRLPLAPDAASARGLQTGQPPGHAHQAAVLGDAGRHSLGHHLRLLGPAAHLLRHRRLHRQDRRPERLFRLGAVSPPRPLDDRSQTDARRPPNELHGGRAGVLVVPDLHAQPVPVVAVPPGGSGRIQQLGHELHVVPVGHRLDSEIRHPAGRRVESLPECATVLPGPGAG